MPQAATSSISNPGDPPAPLVSASTQGELSTSLPPNMQSEKSSKIPPTTSRSIPVPFRHYSNKQIANPAATRTAARRTLIPWHNNKNKNSSPSTNKSPGKSTLSDVSSLTGATAVYHVAAKGFRAVPSLHVISDHFHLSRVLAATKAKGETHIAVLPDVPPDTTLHNMDVVIAKVLRGVSVKEYYETIWSEGVRTNKAPFYGPWLSDGGKNKVAVEEWAFSKEENEFIAPWNGEKYTQKRVVDIEFVRTTHVAIGPPVIQVKHTQYCRNEGNDRCILAMTVEIRGVPLSECFNVELRWVASRVGTDYLLIELGLMVVFVKSNILAAQIRAGAKEETVKGQSNLLENIVVACHAEAEEAKKHASTLRPEEASPLLSCSRLGDFLAGMFKWRRRSILADRDDDLAVGLRSMDERFQTIVSALERTPRDLPLEHESNIVNQISSASSSLDQVLTYLR